MNHEQDFPVVSLVDAVILQAITRSASDIHFEPTQTTLRVRMRLDGLLYDQEPVDHAVMHQFLSRLKVLANINIAEKRGPKMANFGWPIKGRILICVFPLSLPCWVKKLWCVFLIAVARSWDSSRWDSQRKCLGALKSCCILRVDFF